MSAELLGAWASIGTLVVVIATAIAAFVQLRHLGRQNGLAALNEFRQEFERIADAAFDAIPSIEAGLEDASERKKLAANGKVPDWARPVMPLARLFEILGGYTNRNIVSADLVCDLWAPVVLLWWERLSPFIAVMRRRTGPAMFENWESLAVRSRRWLAKERSTYPKALPRYDLRDPWTDVDVACDTPDVRERP